MSSSVEQQSILTFLASPFVPLAEVSQEDAGVSSKTATVESKRKKAQDPDTPKAKKVRIKHPKPSLASALVVTADMVAVDKGLAPFVGATIYELGGACAVLVFVDPAVHKLLADAVVFVSGEGVLERNRTFKMGGKVCTRHRAEGFFREVSQGVVGKDLDGGYAFSGQTLVAQSLHPSLRALLDFINTFVPHDKFVAITVNSYLASDSIGAHGDNDVEPDEKVGVLALSHGASRVLSFRPKLRDNVALKQLDVATAHGQILVMYGEGFQDKFTHEIRAKTAKKIADEAASVAAGAASPDTAGPVRVSFTFRRHRGAAS